MGQCTTRRVALGQFAGNTPAVHLLPHLLVEKIPNGHIFYEGVAEERLTKISSSMQTTIQPSSAIGAMTTKCNAQSEPAQTARFSSKLEISNPHCAGLDLHKDTIWACTAPFKDGVAPEVVTFPTHTEGLNKLVKHLKERNVTTVAMESTGVYWLAPYLSLLEANLNPCLVNPGDIKNIKGRPKSDRADSVWICRLHSYGFLRASFIPPASILTLRSLCGTRNKLIVESGSAIQRINDELIKMNIRMDIVLSDIGGTSGIHLTEAIIRGEQSPEALYNLLDTQVKKKGKSYILPYLTGRYDENIIFTLETWYDFHNGIQKNIERVNAKIYQILQSFPKKANASDMPPVKKNYREDYVDFPYPLRPVFFEIYGVDLTQLPGVGPDLLVSLISTVGTDLSPWSDASHFVSWLGLAPVNQESAGRRKSGKTKRIDNPLSNAFKMSAMAAKRTTTYLGQTARRLSNRITPKKAKVAIARKLAEIIYNIIRNGMPVHVKTLEEYESRRQVREIKNFVKSLNKFSRGDGFIPEVFEEIQRQNARVKTTVVI